MVVIKTVLVSALHRVGESNSSHHLLECTLLTQNGRKEFDLMK